MKNALYKKPLENFEIVKEEKSPAIDFGVNGALRPPKKEVVDTVVVKEFLNNTTSADSSYYSFREPKGNEAFDKETEKRFEEIKETVLKKGVLEGTQDNDVPEAVEMPTLFENEKQGMNDWKICGQVFDTYVIAQKNDSMFLIDQHAAHERKRFEMLKSDYEQRGVSGQMLLVPIVMDADSLEMQIVREKGEILEKMGFGIEEFGKNSLIIRQTPFVADDDDIKALALEVIEILGEARPSEILSFEEKILDTISCKYAIKANKKLSAIEMEALIRDVESLENKGITTCPHGRPIKVEFTKREIEKMFKRIV